MNTPLGSVRRVNARRTGVGAVGDFNDLIDGRSRLVGVAATPPSVSGIPVPDLGIPQFNALVGIPGSPAATQWQSVQQQFSLENTETSVQQAAQTQFAQAYNDLVSGGSIGVASIEDAASAATGLVINNSTIKGAVSSVTQLVSAAESGNAASVVSAFTGCVVAVMAAAGATGAGAVISAGIAIALALDSLLAGKTTATVCGKNITGTPPKFVFGCAWSGTANVVAAGPSSGAWRQFPNPTRAADAWWFSHQNDCSASILTDCTQQDYNTQWTSSDGSTAWWGCMAPYVSNGSASGVRYARPIDAAFSVYHQLEMDLVAARASGHTAFADFVSGYFSAWRANKEYAFNGLGTPGSRPNLANQDDVAAFRQFLNFWNMAHSADTTWTINSAPGGFNNVVGPFDPTHGVYYYVEMLAYEAGDHPVTINTGPSPLIALGLAPAPSTASSLSTSVRVAAFALGSALIASSAIAYTSKRSLGSVWKNWFGRAKRLVKI